MEDLGLMDGSIFHGKRVLLTGHTGFKGAWLAIWLDLLGAEVIGAALDPTDERSLFVTSGIGTRMQDHRVDIRDREALFDLFAETRPEVVLHLAAQALVLESYRTPLETFDVNVMGTAHVLEAVRRTPTVRAAVMVTTDKCYENREWVHGYRETDAMGGHDPYSASKGAAEIVIASYRRSFFSDPGACGIASARSGNVIGGGDRSADRLVPDLIRAVQADRPLEVRHPDSVRPWQHVLEPLHGYLMLAEGLLKNPGHYAGPWNFGPSPDQLHTVRDLAEAMFKRLGKGSWKAPSRADHPHEAHLLMLDINHAMFQLGWRPRLSFAETVRLTADWYMRENEGDMLGLCRSQINEYISLGDRAR